jgi:hypothetical protein
MGLKGFERRLERVVEGGFARVFKSGLKPIELGRRLTREMDDGRTVDVRGRTVAPNHFTIELSPADQENLAEVVGTLERELADAAREHARDEGYSFMGPVQVEIEQTDELRTGTFAVTARMRQGAGGAGAGSLVLPTGDRVPLGEDTITVGRLPESTIVLADPNVSRNHAEVRPRGTGFVVVDLGSTNGTRVNGVRISEQELVDGDEVSFGNTRMRFEAS